MTDEPQHIGELAQASGVPAKTIRFYEEIDLLPPAQRAENGYRLYDAEDVQRLRFIRNARSLGFTFELESESGPLWLKLTGREGVKQFLLAELGLEVR